METVGLFEAKTKLSELIDRVESGEELLITRHGVPVARLVPAGRATRRTSPRPSRGGRSSGKAPS